MMFGLSISILSDDILQHITYYSFLDQEWIEIFIIFLWFALLEFTSFFRKIRRRRTFYSILTVYENYSSSSSSWDLWCRQMLLEFSYFTLIIIWIINYRISTLRLHHRLMGREWVWKPSLWDLLTSLKCMHKIPLCSKQFQKFPSHILFFSDLSWCLCLANLLYACGLFSLQCSHQHQKMIDFDMVN